MARIARDEGKKCIEIHDEARTPKADEEFNEVQVFKGNEHMPSLPFSEDLICLGEVVGAQGIKGQVRIRTYTENPGTLSHYGDLISSEGRIFKITVNQLKSPSLVIATMQGCVDRNQAEALVGQKFYIRRDQLPAHEEGSYYYHDLIGMTVSAQDHHVIGQVENLQNYGAGDFLEIKSLNGKLYTLPFHKDSILEISLQDKNLLIQRDFLLD